MTFDLSLKDFRGFHNQGYVPVRPITILVGENSAGKTSFLAGMKYVQDFLSNRAEPSFNSDPFQLGTFDQISHFRGGRGGRASQFSISLRQNMQMRKSRSTDLSGNYSVELKLFFNSVDSHAAVVKASISTGRAGLEASIVSDGIQIAHVGENNERHVLDEPSFAPVVAKVEFARYWPFLIRDLKFRLRHRTEGQSDFLSSIENEISMLSDLAESLVRRTRGVIEATSAIRTRPQRTYTPGTEREDGEGSHVPYEIAKRYRARGQNKDEWSSIRGTIEDFGKQSGMFKEISVKSFGQTASDPFQLQFSSGGPKMNLVDLGYGASQVLPILYSIATGQRGGYFLVQQPEVHLHPQAQAALGQFIVDSQQRTGLQFVLETHSDFIVDRVRRAIANKQLRQEDVSILFFERDRLENKITEIELDELGEPVNPPETYRSFFIGEQMKILGL
ncbi:AAA domain-containing protein, putative AbiEii toxin, Type IV TA system [Lutimaribacter pacificus]|uniref:AAA domain-containing protein, putative AbiEii toxin, Type IV TA system n=1 Tax=Lutimaribacter pacificus TaxID=391948 RepID=A0A1H0J6P5_9RHOB|nr:AAA family ATPase [Lutimaribacter pacificus]SDO39021.1 AAA domain-containing protein, putative AbiEii toxin, Type IV TA system [Lutimaribacter pacificus]SHK13633.1 AAA domain-containing protein, putative AbiEii toxin, Type IV TA system [Lutimaribacter pacificus]